MSILTIYRKQFNHNKTLAERTMTQMSDDELYYLDGKLSKSIAQLINHISTKLISGWADIQILKLENEQFATSRRRDIIHKWHDAYSKFEGILESLIESDLEKPVYMKGQKYTIHKAIISHLRENDKLIEQIVNQGKKIKGGEWLPLELPFEKSNAINKYEFIKGSRRNYNLNIKRSKYLLLNLD